jgi:hypothetical protein
MPKPKPPLILLCAPGVRVCETCDGEGAINDEDGYAIVCPGPCRGECVTDLPIPKRMKSGPRRGRA